MSQVEAVPIVIVGGGPAGYTAAIYAARAGLTPVCIEGYSSGGQIVRSYEIHNFPGHPDGIAGSELADRIRDQAERSGARMVASQVESVDLSGPPFVITTDREQFLAGAVIVATGATSRRLGLAGETAFEGRGVCYCAICDGPFFAGRRVAVVGGGDVALEEALALSGIAEQVILVHRRAEFRASVVNRSALARMANITVLTPHVVTDIVGDDTGVTGIEVRDLAQDTTTRIGVEGVFVAIGHEPATEMFRPWLDADPAGFLITVPRTTATNVAGVFAAGDVADPRYRQAITAAASGSAAAMDAERWLNAGRHAPRDATGNAGNAGVASDAASRADEPRYAWRP
jgi:thioredoxin reductase (NADPH)